MDRGQGEGKKINTSDRIMKELLILVAPDAPLKAIDEIQMELVNSSLSEKYKIFVTNKPIHVVPTNLQLKLLEDILLELRKITKQSEKVYPKWDII